MGGGSPRAGCRRELDEDTCGVVAGPASPHRASSRQHTTCGDAANAQRPPVLLLAPVPGAWRQPGRKSGGSIPIRDTARRFRGYERAPLRILPFLYDVVREELPSL